ncbi:O-antigen ligase family protein [Psychroserpens ponticola]|uniref:O-antigen ligase family protein n=1 Tax=Psychroserpens ponticola TaxID=2932268 RepID=A0ABY7RWQ6_9FLAO|nr:O-antigen ligase family protein [Psychroserpens ponticola]WCO01130.1 O-antigen ligase family protein [Psychroserpens ponticola]
MASALNNFTWDFKLYKQWFGSREVALKWMLVVILLFPFFAATWEMKETSGFSPLQVLGLMVFVFGFLFYVRKSTRTPNLTIAFFIFIFLFVLNHFLVFGFEQSFSQFGQSIRAILPFVLFFYFRKHLNSVIDIEGFLITFLIASVFPIGTLYYEILFDPIVEVYNTESRGGGLRLSGFYADLFGYMSHLICGFVCYCYFYIKNSNRKKKHFVFGNFGFIIVLLIFLVGVYNLRHQASWAVSIVLLIVFIYFIRKKVSVLQLAIFFVIMFGVGIYFYFEIFEVLYAKDISVAEGNADDSRALNGRVWIWRRYFAYWEDFNILSQVFGSGLAQHEKAKVMMSGGMHNDYVRIFFTTGIFGILCYLYFLLTVLRSSFKPMIVEFKFLLLANLIVVAMYSISSLPLLASGAMMYFVTAMFGQTNKRGIW